MSVRSTMFVDALKSNAANGSSDPNAGFWAARVFNVLALIVGGDNFDTLGKEEILSTLFDVTTKAPTDVLMSAQLLREMMGLQPPVE